MTTEATIQFFILVRLRIVAIRAESAPIADQRSA